MATATKQPARGWGADLYESDVVAWAEALRARRLDELDLEHLAGEFADVVR